MKKIDLTDKSRQIKENEQMIADRAMFYLRKDLKDDLHYQFIFTDHKYNVVKNQGVVVCEVSFKVIARNHKFDTEVLTHKTSGIAVCKKEDLKDFSEEKGKQLARAKAEKKAFEYVEKRFRSVQEYMNEKIEKMNSIRFRMNIAIDHQIEYLKNFQED